MSDLLARTQLELLAHTLGAAPERINLLDDLGAEKLSELRDLTSAYLFDALSPIFARVSKLAPLVPDAIVVKVVPLAVSPLIAGRAAGALGMDHPDRISGILRGMAPQYMADAAPNIDPRAIPAVAPQLDVAVFLPAAELLLARRDYTTASRFFEYATDQLIVELVVAIKDLAGLAHTIAMLPTDERLNAALHVIPAARCAQIVAHAIGGNAVLAALSIVARAEADLRTTLSAHAIDSLDDTGLAEVVRAAGEGGGDAELRILCDALDAERRDRVHALAGERPAVTWLLGERRRDNGCFVVE